MLGSGVLGLGVSAGFRLVEGLGVSGAGHLRIFGMWGLGLGFFGLGFWSLGLRILGFWV